MTDKLPPRARLACGVCNLTRRALRALGRGGTNLPGKLALRIEPTGLRHSPLAKPSEGCGCGRIVSFPAFSCMPQTPSSSQPEIAP